MNARLIPANRHAFAAVVLAAASAWFIHHAFTVAGALAGKTVSQYAVPYAAMFALLTWNLFSSYFNKPFAYASNRQKSRVMGLRVTAVVPVYNEDPDALRKCLQSMVNQYHKPTTVIVVDDGSKQELAEKYIAIRRVMDYEFGRADIAFYWIIQENKGKRHAQAAAFTHEHESNTDLFWTVDSDTISDAFALYELIIPFKDPEIQSVAGIVMAANVKKSFLTRFTDLWFVASQLADRSTQSVFNSVWVNSGPIAVYRASLVYDNLQGYLSETFIGRSVRFSDDSLLTLYAMMRGKTVQQPSAFCFSLMPEDTSHFVRMFTRWMRGSFIRSLWRMRYLPMTSWAYWLHLFRWIQTAIATIVFILVAVGTLQHFSPRGIFWMAAVPILIGYAVCLRYLVIKRSDQSTIYQIGTWAMAPIAILYSMTVLRALRWYGVFTCRKTGWGTRQKVEVALS